MNDLWKAQYVSCLLQLQLSKSQLVEQRVTAYLDFSKVFELYYYETHK